MLGKVTGKNVDCLVCPVRLAMILLKDKELADNLPMMNRNCFFAFVTLLHRLFLTSMSTNIKLKCLVESYTAVCCTQSSTMAICEHGNFTR